MDYDYDVIIVGGGPAGATTALYGAQHGLKMLLVDKKHFPRDKICGDAISGKSVVYLRELGLLDELEKSPQVGVDSVIFSAPNQTAARIGFTPGHYEGVTKGYVCRRMVFDNILFQAAKKKVETIEGLSVEDVIKPNGQVQGIVGKTEEGKEVSITAKVVVGADGFSSVISRKMGLYEHDPDHMLVATRAYYRGVGGLDGNAIELHYVKDILPGYFWIFPLEDGLANVGLGMVHSALKKKGIRLRYAHIEATKSAFFRERFKNAELLGDIHGWNLPVGSKRRPAAGNGFILTGDAAGLIDPFTGEGIGNAMCSGKIAAEVLAEICQGTDYSANTLIEYENRLWKRLGGELRLGYQLQRTARFLPLVNLVIGKAARSRKVADWISGMMSGTISKRELLSPMTYIKLLFQ